jgi:hypothetical protein
MPTDKPVNPVSAIGAVSHPTHGTFHIFYNVETGLYGVSKNPDFQRCTSPNLAAAFQTRGL